MKQRVISLLHVEDDAMQRELLQHHLAVIDEYQFNVQIAESEHKALEIFDGGGTDFIILDYQLRAGDGLNCLKELRKRDPVVPVVAISGVATAQIASELLQAGADEYLSKPDLTSRRLASVVREALRRADAFRPRIIGNRSQTASERSSGDLRNGFAGRQS
jgi:DNA-binding response OmpR family regulator